MQASPIVSLDIYRFLYQYIFILAAFIFSIMEV